jgi:hypothetical protein
MSPIALLTDFGSQDWFVASMKGVILSVNPQASIVDINHNVAAGDITAAAFNLIACHDFFPKGTIFVSVVDPGVGSTRNAIAIFAGEYFFVGPDNGIFSPIIDNYYKPQIHALREGRYFLDTVSATFHGRDIFAPVAAHLSNGVGLEKFGPAHEDIIRLDIPTARAKGKRISGQIIYIDHFGNAITNIPSSLSLQAKNLHLKKLSIPLCNCYEDVADKKPCAVRGSCGFVEIAINKGNAAKKLALKTNEAVSIL